MAPKAIGSDDKIPVSSRPAPRSTFTWISSLTSRLPRLVSVSIRTRPHSNRFESQCTTPDQLVLELEKLEDALAPEETEDTWGKFEKALLRFAAVTRGGGYRHTDVYMQGVGIKGLGDKIVRCVSTDVKIICLPGGTTC